MKFSGKLVAIETRSFPAISAYNDGRYQHARGEYLMMYCCRQCRLQLKPDNFSIHKAKFDAESMKSIYIFRLSPPKRVESQSSERA